MASQLPLRRSACQRGLSIPESASTRRIRLPRQTSPRKRVRFAETHIIPSKHSLLSLTDETISLIFHHLGAFDTSGTFETPRHAFQLALTNTRFLHLFTIGLTCIAPTVDNETPKTLSYPHILSVIRLTGAVLRELHLPASSAPVLPILSDLCPNLQILSFIDNGRYYKIFKLDATFRNLPLHSISITSPTKHAFRCLIPPPPQQLILKNVSSSPELRTLLQNPHPPNKLFLDFTSLGHYSDFRKALHDICPKVEELTLKAPISGHPNKLFRREAMELLQTPRKNKASRCRKILLENDLMELVQHAHPEAVVELTYSNQTFVSDDHGIYAKRIPLCVQYETEDISRLTEVVVGPHVKPKWKALLSGKRLSRITTRFTSFLELVIICDHVELLEISARAIPRVMWDKPLGNITEIRVTDRFDCDDLNEMLSFFFHLGHILRLFSGRTLWLQHHRRFRLLRGSTCFWDATKFLLGFLDEFEARGGDAGTVRAMVNDVDWY